MSVTIRAAHAADIFRLQEIERAAAELFRDSDLIDILIIQIAPVLLGAGIPLFTQKEALKRFTLMDVKRYGQFAELEYHRKSH